MKKQGVSLEERGLLTLAALNHLDQGITVFDRNLELVTWNQYFIELLDFPEDLTKVGIHIKEFFRFNASRGEYGPGDPEEQVNERLRLAARLESHCFERVRPNGQVIEIQGSPLEGGGFVSIYTDITARRHAEKALRENRDLLEQRVKTRTSALFDVNQVLKQEIIEHKEAQHALLESQKLNAIGQLTGGIAHDFNNLLTIIQGNLDIIGIDTIKDDEIRESLSAAQRAAKRGADLTRHLLAFARRQSLEPISVSQDWVTTEIGELLHRTLGESIQLQIRTTSKKWNVLADPVQLENAILNLAINARDAMPEGGDLVIRIKNLTLTEREHHSPDTVPPGDYILFVIEDSGLGMEATVMEHACEPFFTTKEMGTGLGLSTVYGFARQSGGWFSLTSQPGKGTQAVLAMPRADSENEQETVSEATTFPRSS
ncbi:MAG: PAS-domain containing protein, partial [Arenicellales bacterium]|nr:PAS-domain containing protein [Arenicellales bacterium]